MGLRSGEVSSMCANIWQEGDKKREPDSSHPTDRTRENGQIKTCAITCSGFILLVGLNQVPTSPVLVWLPQAAFLSTSHPKTYNVMTHSCVHTKNILQCPLCWDKLFFFFTIAGDHYLYTPWDNYFFGHLLWSFFCCQKGLGQLQWLKITETKQQGRIDGHWVKCQGMSMSWRQIS